MNILKLSQNRGSSIFLSRSGVWDEKSGEFAAYEVAPRNIAEQIIEGKKK